MGDWSEKEVDLILQVYFEMLKKQLLDESYSKTEYRRNLVPLLNNRSEGAIEFKHQNISAALIKLGQPYIKGYLPRYNYQQILDEKLIEYLHADRKIEDLFKTFADKEIVTSPFQTNFDKMLVKPPAFEEISEPRPYYYKNPIKINYLEREQRNSKLGFLGEELIFEYEKWNLVKQGKENLAHEVRWISKDEGDGAGYDILSKTVNGKDKFIEVKTTKLGSKTPFFFSKNELDFSDHFSEEYYLFRVFDFQDNPRFFTKKGGLDEICQYTPVKFKGYF